MARPTKYNSEILERATELVRKGYTLREVARLCEASEASLSRWRYQHPEFNKAIVKATMEQQDKVRSLCGIRGYKREVSLPLEHTSNQTAEEVKHLNKTLKKHEVKTWMGLPIRPQPKTYDEPTDYYLNPNSGYVERIDKDGVLHVCRPEVWEEKHRPKPQIPFIIEFL